MEATISQNEGIQLFIWSLVVDITVHCICLGAMQINKHAQGDTFLETRCALVFLTLFFFVFLS
jgi:hypothetical protein